jgi:hypothetical protein
MGSMTKWSKDRYLQVEGNGTFVLYDHGAGRDADKKRKQMMKRKKRKMTAQRKTAKRKPTKRKSTTKRKKTKREYIGSKEGKDF